MVVKSYLDIVQIFNRENSMIVSANTIAAEGLGGFVKSLGKHGFNSSKKMAKNVFQKT